MSKYNMGQCEEMNCKLTITELCNEIAEENIEMDASFNDTLRDKFSNHYKTGIIDKLESKLNFRINDFDEQYAKLKILKMFYYIEKNGVSVHNKKSPIETRTRIIDILNKPRLDNINTDFSLVSQYGLIFGNMKAEVEKEVNECSVKSKKEKLESFNAYWEVILDKLFDYVFTDKALEKPEETMMELNRIENFLTERVLQKLPQASNMQLQHKERLNDTFYNMLLCHEMICNEADRLNINYQIHTEEDPSAEYVECFIKYENWTVKPELIPMIAELIDNGIENAAAEIVLMLIAGKKGLDDDECKNIKFALGYAEVLLEWLKKFKQPDFSNGYYLSWFVSVVQEISVVKENDERLKNDYYGNKYTNKPLLSALKKPDKAEAVFIKAWIKKVENRYAVNLGAYELIKKKRLAENVIYKIKQKIFSYQNLDDLETANHFIAHFVARSLISRELAMTVGNEFAYKVAERTGYESFQLCENAVNVFDMFREFLVCTGTLERVADEVADMVLEFEEEQSTVIAKKMKYEFNLHLSSSYDKNFMLLFWVNRYTKIIEYDNFFEIIADESVDEIIRLGLEKFIIK
ncbi:MULTISPECIES: hypothetical protein [Clostridium]|uniref:TIGR02678 family protein n=1 Tax=Clostridium frigoriphilum TaxID=443253 RepID=A0ABU7UPW5_9CLOT|nr:hypothetical protein [Clostridium sp. DSM 17811]MBU3100701.1 hypothetical protein [Clostridium sp. DSM 17811]